MIIARTTPKLSRWRGSLLLCALVILIATQASAQGSGGVETPLTQPCSRLSSARVTSTPDSLDPSTNRPIDRNRLPMRVDIGRYRMLADTLAGYKATGVPLTAVRGGRVTAGAGSDDVGLFYVVTKLSAWFHLGLDAALYTFFLPVIAVSYLLGTLGFVRLLRRRSDRVVAVVALTGGLLIAYFMAGDIYIFPFLVPMGLVPWVLYYRRSTSLLKVIAFVFGTGIALSLARSVRIDSALPTLAFALVMLLFGYAVRWRVRLLLVAVLLIATFLPSVFWRYQVSHRDAFLAATDAQYKPASGHHVLWHDIYIGFGFLSNPYIAGYCDEEGLKAVKTVSQTAIYPSSEYESIIRTKVFELIKRDPALALFTLFSKIAVTALMFIACANVGLLAAIRRPKPWPIELAFWSAILLSSIAGVLTVPLPKYAIAVVAFGILYGISSWGMRKERFKPGRPIDYYDRASALEKDALPSR